MRKAKALQQGELLGLGEMTRLLGVTRQYAARRASPGAVKIVETPFGNLYRRADMEPLAAERRERQGAIAG